MMMQFYLTRGHDLTQPLTDWLTPRVEVKGTDNSDKRRLTDNLATIKVALARPDRFAYE